MLISIHVNKIYELCGIERDTNNYSEVKGLNWNGRCRSC